MRSILYATAFVMVLFVQNLQAIHLGASDDGKPLPWSRKMEHPLDEAVNKGSPDTPFLMNLGPTGIRAMIEPDNPKAFKVKFVFQDAKSPAKGLINKGDYIIGVNGKPFKNDHGFHRKRAGSRGWQGPPYELALAIEDCQGTDGKLDLLVLKGGPKGSKTTVTVQLKPVGRFASTWPWDCPRSAKLRDNLADFLSQNFGKSRVHLGVQKTLALYASGHKDGEARFKAMGEKMSGQIPQPSNTGMCTWGWGYQGILLGEYYNKYKDKGVKPAVEALLDCYTKGMDYRNGGFSHRPFPAIERRVADGGPKGYGAMAGPGGLSMLAQSTFKAVGLPVADLPYNRTHEAYLAGPGQNESGGLAYGFGNGWDSAMIRLKDPSTPCKNEKGVGYMVPTGLKNAGPFVVEKWYQEGGKWNKKMVDPKGEFGWIKNESDKLIVHVVGRYLENKSIQQRQVTLPHYSKEPSGPIPNNRSGAGHPAPVGMGALAHYIGNKDNASWNYLGQHMATCCASSAKTMWDGHAAAEMHAFWCAVAAFRADEKDLRAFLDYSKTWIILSEPHDGQGLVEQPFGCQRNSTCSVSLDRSAYTHVALIMLSVPNRNLLITGADYAQPAASSSYGSGSSSGSSGGSSSSFSTKKSSFTSGGGTAVGPAALRMKRPTTRAARSLSAGTLKALDKSLLKTLAKLSDGNALKAIPLQISITRPKLYLTKASADGTLTFQVAGSSKTADVQWNSLKEGDRATLALLVATLKTDSSDAQALAGIYLESVGRVTDADKFYAKASEESRKKFEKLFD